MKTITDDPEGFFDNGGWSFLGPDSDVSASVFYHSPKLLVVSVNYIGSFSQARALVTG